jgi:LacI family transcriptional regulator
MRISARLADKIREVARQEGYQPNQVAVSLRTGKSKIIGLIVDTISGSFFASLAGIIEKEMEPHGYRVIYCSTGNDLNKGEELIRMLYQHHVDGFLIIPTSGMAANIQTVRQAGKPLVLMDSYFPGTDAPYVLVDNYRGMSEGVQHLIDKRYQKIALVCNDVDLIQMKDRCRAYTETLEQNGRNASPRLILKTAFHSTREEIVTGLEGFIRKAKPDAVVFAANYLGVAGLEYIKKAGIKVPEELAVLCFDDHEIFALHHPEITVVQQPVEEIAKTAVHLLFAELGLKKPVADYQLQLAPRLVLRQST